jgi:4-diphosphocytidyl-2-C-methyl-D-erythritol kinase
MEILCPAKVNLCLHVTGKRQDGYHNLYSLMCCIDIWDRLAIEVAGRGIRITCTNPEVPDDQSNLAYRAAERFIDQLTTQYGQPCDGVKIHIDKQIPIAAGLGGGSSDAAAVFSGLNRHFGSPFSRKDLMVLALEIGADVPFFIFGRAAIATGIGEQLEPYPSLKPYNVVLIYPGIRVSTAEVYKNLDLGLTNYEKEPKKLLLEDKVYDAALHLCNDLESVVFSCFPEIVSIKKALLDNGAIGALVSGSGSSVFGLYEDLTTAQNAKRALDSNTAWKVFSTQLVIDGGCRIQEH